MALYTLLSVYVGKWVGGLWYPCGYLVQTKLQFWLLCCWGCRCRWALTIEMHILTGFQVSGLPWFSLP